MSKRKGFTLLELIIALMIMTMIGSILLPNYTKVQRKAKENAVKTIAYNLQMALESYAIDLGGYPSDTSLDITQLCTLLIDNKDISKMPKNPFTNQLYTSSDPSGLMSYAYNISDDIYSLQVMGYLNEQMVLSLSNL